MNRLRVLKVITRGGYYRAENMAIQLSLALKSLDHDLIIGVFRNSHRPNNELAEAAQRCGLEVELIDCKGKIAFQTIPTIRNCVLGRQIDVGDSHRYKANIYAYLATRATNARLVSTCHSWPGKTIALR